MAFEFDYVFFTASGALAARIYRDVDDLVTRRPAVLVTGSWLTVKEQMPRRYALALADEGFTAVTFDFSGFGASHGSPRQAELPSRKVGEITAVAEILDTLSFVQPGGIGYLGVCASAQYGLRALARGAPVAAFASVAGWFHDTATVAAFYGGQAGLTMRFDRARQALAAFQDSAEVRVVPAFGEGNDRAGMFVPMDYYALAARGAVPQWRNEMAELSWLYWLTFDGLSVAEEVSTPTVFVHSDDCALPGNVRALAGRMPHAELVWGEGSQTDFYDQPGQVAFAVRAAARHFRAHLIPSRDREPARD
jgi:uncharacterized protein